MGRNRRQAFTLMEIVLVLAVLVIVAAIAIPVATTMLGRSQLHAASDTVRTQLTRTRNQAMEDRIPYRFAVMENTGSFRIAPNTMDWWEDGDVDMDAFIPSRVLEVQGTLPETVRFGPTLGGEPSMGMWRTVAVFQPDGSAEANVEISLNRDGSPPLVVRLQAATGTITTASLPAQSAEY